MHGKKSEFNSELFKKVDQAQIFKVEMKMTVMSFDFFAKNRIEVKKKPQQLSGLKLELRKFIISISVSYLLENFANMFIGLCCYHFGSILFEIGHSSKIIGVMPSHFKYS
jgi:hypothetical protein|tara:strand:+ start:579 stop:908 length:330 start_codon:yes stop_codon:yes gene_type:complete